MLVSFVAPAYNEAQNIKPFMDAVERAFEASESICCEVVFVDDGSTDGTLEAMRRQIGMFGTDVKVIELSRNFGKEAALYAGLEHASGSVVVFIDSDLQQPPSVAYDMLMRLIETPEVDCVAAYQQDRKQSRLVNACSRLFYRLLGASSGMDVLADASDFRAFRRNVADALLSMPEYYRFSKGLFAWVGFRTLSFPYTPEKRLSGSSSWSFWKLVKYAAGGLLSFTTFPLKIAIWIGGAASLIAICYLAVVLGQRLFSELMFRVTQPLFL